MKIEIEYDINYDTKHGESNIVFVNIPENYTKEDVHKALVNMGEIEPIIPRDFDFQVIPKGEKS